VEALIAQWESGGNSGGGRNRPTLILADGAGQVVYDERGQRAGTALTAEERARAIELTTNAGPYGFVVFSVAAGGALTPMQQSFLQQLRTSFVIAALVAGALGMVLGLVFSRALSAPLAQLASAARALAQRQWPRWAAPSTPWPILCNRPRPCAAISWPILLTNCARR
jgi:hypothetical protein